MSLRKLLLLLLFIFGCEVAFGATFTVTSKADAGPGTLRQALLDAAANGTGTIDYINFNLSGYTNPANITILLKTALPAVTGNIIIDGSTQPGPALGVSGAKIILTPAAPAQNFDAFDVSVLVSPTDAVEFYGLYIKDFSHDQQGLGNGIVTFGDCKLVIGAPGKGNVISGNWFALFGYFGNAKIQSNLFSVDVDGLTERPNFTILYSNYDYNNLLIGGDDLADGNVIAGGYSEGISFYGINTTPQAVTIKNNYFGTNYTGNGQLMVDYNGFLQTKDPQIEMYVYNNTFAAGNLAINILTRGLLVVKGNYFGTDKTQKYPLGSGDEAIHIVTNVTATIGGDAAGDQNVFTNYRNPIFADNDANMLVVKNSFYCNEYVSLGNLVSDSFVTITDLQDNSVSGEASPGALIQLYYATSAGCPNCNPTTWFANVTAGTDGKWKYAGDTRQDVLASATVNKNTFGFQRFIVYPSDATVVDYDCHHNGSIKVNQNRTGRLQFVWIDNATQKTVGTGREIDNLPPGVYNLQIDEGSSCLQLAEGQFTIKDLSPHALSSEFYLDCNHATGTLGAFYDFNDPYAITNYYWEDATGKLISTDAEVSGLAAGDYYLSIKDANGCTSSKTEYYVYPLIDAPTIDDSKVTTSDAHCDQPDGSITGLTITNGGTSNYGWSTADGTQVTFGTTDITNAPAGQYYFFAEYDSNCPVVKSKLFTINSLNGVSMDASGIIITSSTCANSNGAIRGLAVKNAATFQWFDDKKKVVGNKIDLDNVPAGDYYLVASNAICSAQSQVFTVSNLPAINNYPSTETENDATCGENNGSISVNFTTGNAPATYRWVNAAGTTLVKDANLTDLAPGGYQLYVTDVNGCESLYKSYTINAIAPIAIAATSAQIKNDQCGQNLGAISGISITGGVPPYTYTWLNSAQQSISTNLNLSGLAQGTYTLQVKDATACGLATQDFTVINESPVIAPPQVDNLQICSPGTALLLVKNPESGYGYRLYGSATGTDVVGDEANGIFRISVTGSGSLYVSKYIGGCESARTPITVTVGLSAVDIPNTFTPNNDGINDTWQLNGLINYPDVLVQIFNRYGQKVFESKGYAQPFDGKIDGALLPPGVYYYIIKLNTNCSLLSGSLTLIR